MNLMEDAGGAGSAGQIVDSIAPHRAGGAVWRCGRRAGPGQGLAAWPPTPGCSSSKTPAAPAVPGSSCIVDSIAPHRAGGAVWRCGRRAG